ncbi:MAG: sigma 54-interacting transcriptional regulator [Candidatus Cloacimonetes bacterium]|nr:sigma 54-interacting transcriptional regulator [Candidatus Cloacimonadota bacterium]
MSKKIENILAKFVTKDFSLIEDISKQLKIEESKIIELIGESGSGKSLIFKTLSNTLEKEELPFVYYIPSIFKYNQFKEIVKLVTNISDKIYSEILKKSQEFNFKNKYDLFYYFTENLSESKVLKSKTIIIYGGCNLDNYTIDFIQYLIQYSSKVNIQFIIFTRKETFSFSQKIHIPIPKAEDIREVIKILIPDKKSKFATESEIVENISGGNLFMINYILSHLLLKDKTFDFNSFIDKKIDIKTILTQNIKALNETQSRLLFTVFLLDTNATVPNLKKLFDTNILNKHLMELSKRKLIFELDKKYYIKKVSGIKEYFFSISKTKQKEYYKPVIKILDKEQIFDLCIIINDCDITIFDRIIDDLSKVKDFQSLIEIYKIYLKKIDRPEKEIEILVELGKASKNLARIENAAEYFRQALKICVKNSLSTDEVVYYLADSLFAMNSSAFALEILKKNSPTSEDSILICRTALLKAEILQDMEKLEEAREITEETFHIADQIKDIDVRFEVKADLKKMMGKVYYSWVDWNKAQTEFEDAEKLYLKVNNLEGLAAVYNNLGVLAMYRGEGKNAESLFLKSLKYEKEKYNLSGISVCYSNLGYIFEDKSDYKKSLYYLNEALKIQKLLSDRNKITTIYLNIGVAYMDNGKYKKAEEAFNQLLEIAIEFNMYDNVIAALNNLGALFFKSGNFQKAIDYYERAIEKSKDNNFNDGLIKSYNNMGELFEKRGEYNIAYDYYSKSKELLPNISDELMKAELYGNLGSVLTALHKFKEAYPYLVESYDFFKSLNHRNKIIEGAQKQAFYFIHTRNYESANYYIDSALKLAEEIGDEFHIGKCYYLRALLEKNNSELALDMLKKAIEMFVKTKNDFELAMTNYEYASLLLEKEDWEQALQILRDNSKIIKHFEAIKFLEKNDILIQKINKKYTIELKESKLQETILNKFYEITQELNDITDFDILIENALDKLVDFSEADGGIFTLYYNQLVKDSWDYIIFSNFTNEDKDFVMMMDLVRKTFDEGVSQNYKQPHFAPEYNNIISFPLVVRNDKKGVICLFTKHGSHYFTEKMYNLVSALCNQIVVTVENISYENLQKSHEVIREELAASSTFTNIIGKSEKIQGIFRMIEKIKNTPTTILLEGASGTGKELIARAIHYNSNRRNKKFVAQYCGALPETLLESELFGHIKGSFTGATHDKKGLFEVADGGTFFLDEIADISLSTQAKLLRFLQEGEIKRVGSTQTQKVDVRVICATNVSLQDRVKKGEFRVDLFYRLNVIRIEIPSLKERKSDIPLLAVHFLDKYCSKMDKNVNGITEEAMMYLMNYDWPGNIRQLENEIERAVTLAEDDSSIKSSDLSEEIFRFEEHVEAVSLLDKKSLKDAVEKLEKQMIVNVLNEHDWNQTKAAKTLGLSRQGLIKKMQRYKIVK